MEVKAKLTTILNRLKNFVIPDLESEYVGYEKGYTDGFEYATKLFDVAIQKEFGKYVQIEENKSIIIREKDKEIAQLSGFLLSKQRYIDHLETILENASFKGLSASKMKKVIYLIAHASGRSYEAVRGQLLDILEGKAVRNG